MKTRQSRGYRKMKAYLKAEGVSKFYEGQKIIDHIDIQLNQDEFVSLLGPSGIGKTTLFNILAGISAPDEGRVLLEGRDITGVSGNAGYMQQKDLLLPYKSILDNVCIPLRLKGVHKKEAQVKALPLFREFGIEGYENKYPSQLSGGMRQRAALLRTYLFSEKLMLLDEPFSALDAMTRASMHRWFQQIAKTHHTSAILITHDIDEAIFLSNRIYLMAGTPGKIVREIQIQRPGEKDESFLQTERFMEYKREIYEILKL